MPLILPRKSDLPVFDIPSENIYKTDFVDRRVLTIVGRALLSEKNQPIKPSTDYKFRKCYSAYNEILYKLKTEPDDKAFAEFKQKIVITELTDYSIPLAYYYNYRKLRQKSVYYPIDTELSSEITPFEVTYIKVLKPLLSNDYKPVHTKTIKIDNWFPYGYDNFNFRFQIPQTDLTEKLLLRQESQIVSNEEKPDVEYYSFHNDELVIKNEFTQICLYDFSKYSYSNLNNYRFLGLDSFLKPIEPNKDIVVEKAPFESDYKLKKVFRYLEAIKYVWKSIYEEATTSDYFAKFYLTANTKLKPYLDNLNSNNDVNFLTDISNFIADRQESNFPSRNFNTKEKEIYKTLPQKNSNSLKSESIKEFSIDLKNENFDAYSFKKQILAGKKPLVVPIKYKAPRRAFKLKISKPSFLTKDKIYKMQNLERITAQILIPRRNRLKADYTRVLFNHKSPISFSNLINEDSLKISNSYRLRRSSFFNKSPKHALYSYKAIHNITSKISFNNSKKLRFLFKAFILPRLTPKSKKAKTPEYLSNFQIPPKITYIQKPVKEKILINRCIIEKIVLSEKNKISVSKNSPIERLTEIIRIGANRLRSLRLLLHNIFKKKSDYSISFLKPQKRILPPKTKQPINKVALYLNVLKNTDALFSKPSQKTDCFTSIYYPEDYSFCEYLPKQIVDQFNINFDIIGINRIRNLQQKNIIPPPGWKKQLKSFICKLRLGPYPFGFPDFSFGPPKFYQLTTRDSYSIKDVIIDNIYNESFFILTKSKLYVPELSMKNPKRLLHTDITPNNSPKEYYASKGNDTNLKQDQPEKINSFKQSWEKEDVHDYVARIITSFLSSQRIRSKKYLFKKLKTINNSYSLSENYIRGVMTTIMPQINRFLIRSRKFKLARISGILYQKGFTNYWNSKLAIDLKDNTKPDFVAKNLGCHITRQKDWTLPQFFPDTYPVKEYNPEYTTRFRTFRFPYIPENKFTFENTLFFAKEADENSYNSCKFQEDFRVSQFDFGLVDIHDDYTENYYSDYQDNIKASNSFIISSENVNSNKLKEFISPKLLKPNLNNNDIPEQLQHLITPKFFKILENHSYKFKRRGQTINSLKYSQSLKNSKENYYSKQENNPYTMDSPSFHWIILLRKNKNIQLKVNYLSEEKLMDFEEFQAKYSNNVFGNEKYFDFNLQIPQIEPLVRDTFAKEDYIKEIMLSSTYISEIRFTQRKITEKSLCVIPPKASHNKMEEKKPFEYKLQKPEKYNGIVIEPNNSIEKFGKSKLAFSAFIFNKEEGEFKQSSSTRPKRMSYRPIYIPDFIDLKTNEKEIEIID